MASLQDAAAGRQEERDFQASLGYVARLCLKAQQPNKTNNENKGQAERTSVCEALSSLVGEEKRV